MQTIAKIVLALLAYYATFATMGVGFAMMLRGPQGAAAAWRFFFVRPLQWATQQARLLTITLIVASWKFALHRIVDPFILAVERAIIWLMTRQRGWLRRP